MKKQCLSALVLALVLGCPLHVRAQVPCDLPLEDLRGICILEAPAGMRLGSRQIRPGDFLTAAQAEKLTWAPEEKGSALAAWLPVGPQGPESRETLLLSRRNRAPIAEDTAMETYRNLSARKKLPVREPEGETMSLALMRPPRRGTVQLSPDGFCTYTPHKNKIGPDFFTYRASDPQGNSSREARVTVEILRPSDAPQFQDTRDCAVPAQWLREQGLWEPEGTLFRPEKPVTRGEFLTALVRALDLPTEETVLPEQLQDLPLWFQPYAAAALRSGLFAPLSGPDTFDPEIPITRSQARAMVDTALQLPVLSGDRVSPVLTRGEGAFLLWDSFSGQ